MKYIGNIPEQNIIHTTADRYDYVYASNPTIDVNPSILYATWLNTTTGELFVCRDNCNGANVWYGQRSTYISLFSTDGLVALYNFESNVVDDSLSGNDGIAFGIGYTAGVVGSAASFDGSTSYVDIDSVKGEFTDNSPFTISGFFKTSSLVPQQELVEICKDTEKTGFRVLLYQGDLLLQLEDGADRVTLTLPETLNSINEWHYFCARHDGTYSELVIDYTSSGQTVLGTYVAPTGAYLGCDDALNANLLGQLDDIRIYNRYITDNEMSTLRENSSA